MKIAASKFSFISTSVHVWGMGVSLCSQDIKCSGHDFNFSYSREVVTWLVWQPLFVSTAKLVQLLFCRFRQ